MANGRSVIGRWMVASVALLAIGCADGGSGSSGGGGGAGAAGVSYHGIPDGYGIPAAAGALEQAILQKDRRRMREHAWNVWAAITAPSGESFNGTPLPVWETWFSADDLYGTGTPACDAATPGIGGRGRDFENPAQHVHGGNPLEKEDVTSLDRFTIEVVDHVCERGYNDARVLDGLNASFTSSTPIRDRSIDDFPTGAVGLKPVFRIVHQSGVTIMPYWAGSGPEATSDPLRPSFGTWRQCVAVVPPGEAAPPSPVVAPCNDEAVYPAEVIGLDRFYAFPLTQAEIDAIPDDADVGPDAPVAGDYAVLVAMHVTTKELPEWTWQTFWWSPTPDAGPDGDFRPNLVRGAWRNYQMCTAWVTTGPPEVPGAPPVICFNPYLETGLQDVIGKESNCKTCHSMAAWPNFSTDYQANGFVDRDDPAIFGRSTKVDFLWSVTRAQ